MLITHCRMAASEADGALLIRDGRIAAIGASRDLEHAYPVEERLNARGEWLLPGNICAHTHFYGAFARGMALGSAPANFPEILEQLWWKLDKALTLEDIRYSALVCLLDAIRHGTTTLIDHHASPSAALGSLDIIAQAAQEAGLRVCLCYEVSDRDGQAATEEGLAENARFIACVHREADPRLAALFGLHASLTLSDETLARAVELGRALDVGFHLHVAEDEADVRDSLRRAGMRPVERLARAGVLGPRTIAAHGVHLDAHEIGLLRETGAWVVHNPRSNMNNAVGAAEVERMLAAGVLVGLGNDGFSNDMFQEMKAAYLLHKLAQRDPRAMGADVVMRLAVENNRRLARALFPLPLGELAVGAAADLMLLDYDPPTPVSAANWPWHVIFGVDGGQVTTTIVGGEVLMRDRQILHLDEEGILARARELAARLWRRVAH
jgi:putative selenium metabolism protein SsnA